MSQHDFSIANQGFPSFRSDLNDGLQALVSNSSGATAPSTTYAHQFWVDTAADPSILKVRNADNDAWITLGNIDQTGDTFIFTPAAGSASAPAYTTSGDLNTGVFFPGADIVALSAGGAEKLMASTSEVVVNDGSADVDFRVESDANTHALFVEGSSGNVGIGTSSPAYKLDVSAAKNTTNIKLTSTGLSSADDYAQLSFGDASYIYGAVRLGYNNPSATAASYLAFYNNNGSSTAERARITSAGALLVGKTTADIGTSGIEAQSDGSLYVTKDISSGSQVAIFNRKTSDGTIVSFRKDGTVVGSIASVATGKIGFYGSGGTGAVIDSIGNLMVGTTSTSSRFVSYRGDAGFNGYFNSPSGAGSGVYAIGTSLASASNNANCAHLRCTTQTVNTWSLLGNGTSTFSSDQRLKKNIETARNGYLDDVANLRVVKYNWHTDDDSTAKELGLIAQEVEQVFPGLVVEDSEPLGDVQNPKAIKTSVLPYILLKAIQEQQAIIESLKARLDAANL